MTTFTPLSASLGGVLIGLAAILLMVSLGRIAGIAGICGGLATSDKGDRSWRFFFLLGLIGAPLCLGLVKSDLIRSDFTVSWPLIVMGGILVGVGTTLGNGCTSGHGVCGNARFSARSFIATLTFMGFGILTVFLVRHVWGGAL